MSTSETNITPQLTPDSEPEHAFPVRALLIGLGMALLIGAIGILSLGNRNSTDLPTTSGSLLVLAPAAFLAGIFSFLSPCTLPILPAYFAFTFQARRERVVFMTIAFFFGLATTMVIIGAVTTALSKLLFSNKPMITLIGGFVVIVFGIISLLGKGFTGAKLLDRPSASVVGSYLYGATFALGWTACVGPILGALFALLSTQGIAILQGTLLAFIYALGLGMPLILIATFFSRLGNGSRVWKILRGRGFNLKLGFITLYLHTTSVASGLLLILIGILLVTGQMTRISEWAQSTNMGAWSISLERVIERLFFGD